MTVHTQKSPLQKILEQVSQLSHTESLQLIVYLAEQARQTTLQVGTEAQKEVYYWRDIAGIAPNLLEGQDAQKWVSEIRTQEWDRDIPR